MAFALALLLAGGWFAVMGLRAPALLYPSEAGNRIVEKFPSSMPVWWFTLFPDPVRAVAPAGMVKLIPSSVGVTPGVATPERLVDLPPGQYSATFVLSCSSSVQTSSTGAVASDIIFLVEQIEGSSHTTVSERHMNLADCTSVGQEARVSAPFTSVGYKPISFLVQYGPSATISSVQVEYASA